MTSSATPRCLLNSPKPCRDASTIGEREIVKRFYINILHNEPSIWHTLSKPEFAPAIAIARAC